MQRKGAYYNEHDAYAAQWLRNLMAVDVIAPGDVDERSIEDVRPNELMGYAQCHFFAGVGIWSYAMRRAGIPDDYPAWSMSCPCQPFSAAGEGAGFADERHLWPAGHYLIAERRPAVVFGEQVASKDAQPWIDLVHDDMEALGYAFGAIPFAAACVGAPNIRDRLYWMANAQRERHDWIGEQASAGRAGIGRTDAARCASAGWLGNSSNAGLSPRERATVVGEGWGQEGRAVEQSGGASAKPGLPSPVNGYWRDSDWLHCRDHRWRPVEPGTFPLAHGLAASMGKLGAEQGRLAGLARLDGASLARAKRYRVGSLRGYGNALNAEAAIAFIECAMGSA